MNDLQFREHVSVMLAVEDAFQDGAETGAHGITARQVNQADVRRTWPVVFAEHHPPDIVLANYG